MKIAIWLALLGIAAGFAYAFWLVIRRHAERKQAAEERMAAFIAQTVRPTAPKLEPAPAAVAPPAVAGNLAMEKLLFEAAAKAGEAGEAALSIQLYARLIARYPASAFAAQARSAADAQKGKLARS